MQRALTRCVANLSFIVAKMVLGRRREGVRNGGREGERDEVRKIQEGALPVAIISGSIVLNFAAICTSHFIIK